MGVCDSMNEESSKIKVERVKIDGEIKDISKEYLFPESLAHRTPINDKYKLTQSILGQGTSGIVFLGKDNSGKLYAIKNIKKKKILNGQLLIQEARIGLKLNHPHIIKFEEIFEDMKSISFVMEICEGGDLFDFITKFPGGKLPDRDAIYILIQILDTLNYLHNTAKICHRDIKPENFLVSIDRNNRPFVRLIDFGFAQYINDGHKMNGCLGTLHYVAPEILLKKSYDEKVDIWSTGIILFNMLTGCEPFSGSNNEQLKQNIINNSVNFEAIKNTHLRQLCQALLEKDPSRRLNARSALEMAKNVQMSINTR